MSVVVVVEDDDDVSALLSAILREDGHRPVVVAQPGRARATVVEVGADLVLLDLAFPGPTSGLHVLAELREARLSMPVLMITAEEERLGEALAAGATGYLVKPFDVEVLLATIGDALAP